MKINWMYLVIAVLLIAGFIFLNQGILSQNTTIKDNAKSNKLQITASFYPLYFFAQEIGKEKADVKNITPAGVEPHDYEPTPQDIAHMEKSNLLIVNGTGFEPWYEKIKDDLRQKNIRVNEATQGLNLLEGHEEHEEEEKEEEHAKEESILDPHVWLDPQLAKKQVAKITEGYIAVDPASISYYKENERQLNNKLDQIDISYKQGSQSCGSRDIITTHIAFAYLAQRYGLNQVAISGLSPDEEPSAQQLVEVANFAKQNNAKYIFFETLVSPKLAETIANEIGAKTLVLDPIEGLSDDDIKQGKNYFTVMEDNLKNLQTALECSK